MGNSHIFNITLWRKVVVKVAKVVVEHESTCMTCHDGVVEFVKRDGPSKEHTQ